MGQKLTDKIKKKAKELAEDDDRLKEFISLVKAKVEDLRNSDHLKQLIETLELFTQMIKSYLNGEYRDYPKRTLLLILFGLIYFIIPIDAIPDFIPVTGFMDDLTILIWVYKSIQKDIEAYKIWRTHNISTT